MPRVPLRHTCWQKRKSDSRTPHPNTYGRGDKKSNFSLNKGMLKIPTRFSYLHQYFKHREHINGSDRHIWQNLFFTYIQDISNRLSMTGQGIKPPANLGESRRPKTKGSPITFKCRPGVSLHEICFQFTDALFFFQHPINGRRNGLKPWPASSSRSIGRPSRYSSINDSVLKRVAADAFPQKARIMPSIFAWNKPLYSLPDLRDPFTEITIFIICLWPIRASYFPI